MLNTLGSKTKGGAHKFPNMASADAAGDPTFITDKRREIALDSLIYQGGSRDRHFCPFCLSTASTRSNMIRHVHTQHLGNKTGRAYSSGAVEAYLSAIFDNPEKQWVIAKALDKLASTASTPEKKNALEWAVQRVIQVQQQCDGKDSYASTQQSCCQDSHQDCTSVAGQDSPTVHQDCTSVACQDSPTLHQDCTSVACQDSPMAHQDPCSPVLLPCCQESPCVLKPRGKNASRVFVKMSLSQPRCLLAALRKLRFWREGAPISAVPRTWASLVLKDVVICILRRCFFHVLQSPLKGKSTDEGHRSTIIRILLLISGVEQNPGPQEATLNYGTAGVLSHTEKKRIALDSLIDQGGHGDSHFCPFCLKTASNRNHMIRHVHTKHMNNKKGVEYGRDAVEVYLHTTFDNPEERWVLAKALGKLMGELSPTASTPEKKNALAWALQCALEAQPQRCDGKDSHASTQQPCHEDAPMVHQDRTAVASPSSVSNQGGKKPNRRHHHTTVIECVFNNIRLRLILHNFGKNLSPEDEPQIRQLLHEANQGNTVIFLNEVSRKSFKLLCRVAQEERLAVVDDKKCSSHCSLNLIIVRGPLAANQWGVHSIPITEKDTDLTLPWVDFCGFKCVCVHLPGADTTKEDRYLQLCDVSSDLNDFFAYNRQTPCIVAGDFNFMQMVKLNYLTCQPAANGQLKKTVQRSKCIRSALCT